MMHTNINNARKNINNDNQIINESNSNSKIKIRKDLFNINDENTKYTNLDLEVINSWNLPKGLKLHINKDKLDNSLRKVNDGKIYFGYEQEYNNYINKESKLDYILMPKDNEYDEKFIGIHFMIRYDEKKCKYYIKDLGSGYGTFIKLINPLEITNNLLVNIGDTFIVFNLDEDSKNISLKLFTGDEQSENYEFTPEKKLIRIGRDKESDIFIDDKLLSRKQCYIYYQEDENNENNENKYKWFIKDGDISGRKSTNDTWMYSIKDTLIYDQMIFKTNHNLFKCNCY
jgi:pSer/pThr/pTyr-binding forkhead associated (FHA) protein